jgi:hypothetical protein
MHVSRTGLFRVNCVTASVNTIVVTYNGSHHVVVASNHFYNVNNTLLGTLNETFDVRIM